MNLFRAAQKRGEGFNAAMLFALRGVLVSPNFLFRVEEPNPGPEPRVVPDHAMAVRLSYFLWGTMPDSTLFDLAASGKLHDPDTLNEQIDRMLKDAKAREFAERFVEQWLNTRELGRDIQPDHTLFPMYYDAELQAAIKYEPVLFFQEILASNLSLLNLIDSKFTILTNKLQKHYGLEGAKMSPAAQARRPAGRQPPRRRRIHGRGAGRLFLSRSVPARCCAANGFWMHCSALRRLRLRRTCRRCRKIIRVPRRRPAGATGATSRRIPPAPRVTTASTRWASLLENYDVLGRWRTEEAGKPIDAKVELPDGTEFDGADQLKAVLLDRKDLFLRNLTSKMLGYALGRGLTLEDSCTVDKSWPSCSPKEYSSHTLIREIVLSMPFRYQAAVWSIIVK